MATDVSGIVLHKLLTAPDEAIEVFPKLKPSFFSSGYLGIHRAILKFYKKHNTLPNFESLALVSREGIVKNSIIALEDLEVPEDLDWSILLEALVDQYTQEETLNKLDLFLDDVTAMDTKEIKQNLTNIIFHLEEKTHIAEEVYTFADLRLEESEELGVRVPLGFNNSFDALTGGIALTELVLIGGERGSGKSIVAVNIVDSQYMQGNTSILFSIEMRVQEVYWRMLASLSNVRFSAIRKNELTDEEISRVALTLKGMYINSDELYERYLETKNFTEYENALATEKELTPKNKIVIVDNQELTLADIDMNIHKLKSQVGDKLKVVVVDYVNQIEIEDIYDWKSQISLSKGLKILARKHNVVIVAPYQIDKTGEARFSKGLLDAVDVAIILKAGKDFISFETTKARNIPASKFASNMDWETLTISPTEAIIEHDEPEETEGEKKKFKGKVQKDNDDIPF